MRTVRRSWRLRSTGLVVAMLATVVFPLPMAEAAFPGENGVIAYDAQPAESFEPLVYVVGPDGSSPQELVSGAEQPSWSPDGSRLLFERGPYPIGEIIVANADGEHVNLTNHAADDRTPAWSPDGTRIVFASERGEYRLFLMDLADRSVTQLTSGAGLGEFTDDISPTWSPDGRTIVFSRGVPEEGSGASAIFSIGVDGTGLTRLTEPVGVLAGFERLGNPDWSPDGTKIAFDHGGSACSGAIFTMNADGSDPRVLVDTECYDSAPAWSPDGTKVVFESSGPDPFGASPAGLYVVNADGTGLTLLLGDERASDPDWRPVVPAEPVPPVQSTEIVCANVAAEDRFADDGGTTFEAVIECLAHSGITAGGPAGRPEDNYGPGLVVTRAQMASFIAREIDTANELETGAGVGELAAFGGSNGFTDVAADNVHLEAINRLAQAGITGGGPGGRPASEFGPGLPVTRAQMASFINRGHQLLTGTALTTSADYFSDDDASVHEANINGIASEGIVVGDGVSAYGPLAEITRSQMAAFVVRHLAVLEEVGRITPLPA